MNMFVPQTIQSQIEIANIADVRRQIITPRYSRPIIKFKQDTIIGAYLMTQSNKKINYNDAMNIAAYCGGSEIFNLTKEDIYLRTIYSLAIPKQLNYTDSKVNIVNGNILSGTVGDSILNKVIAHYSWDRHGPEITKNYYDNSQRIVIKWLLDNGFSVGLGDAITDDKIINEVKIACEVKNMEVDKLITQMENNPDTLDPETFEMDIKDILKSADNDIEGKTYKYLKENHPDNNFFVMIDSGAKGKANNIGQIISGLGQNVLEFKRIKKKVNNRTLPHIFQNDDRGHARGFIKNSYYHGLDPIEFFFHHMTAREGMIDTAIKTADSGYLQRKLIKGMEDVMVAYDKTVRNGNNVLIQMIYGANGINQTYYKDVPLKVIAMNNEDIKKIFGFTTNEIDNLLKEFTEIDKDKFIEWNNNYCDMMQQLRDDLRIIQMKSRMDYITLQEKYSLPINFTRLIEDARNVIVSGKEVRLNPLYVIAGIKYILRSDVTSITFCDKDSEFKLKDQDRAKYLLKIALLEYLAPKKCIFDYKLTIDQFNQLLVEIIKSFRKASLEPGEMVGIVTAQSLGETLMC